MNIRVIIVVLIIIIFALASTMLNLSVSGVSDLNEVYSSGNITVIQKTAAGTVPHEIVITNNENTAINAKQGTALASSVSEDLIIAEDKQIGANSAETVKAYGIEPSQRAVVNTKLLPVNNSYNGVNNVINNSNPYISQLQIWLIMAGPNFNPYTGEPVEVVNTKKISWSEFRQNIADAKNNLMKKFNVSESEIQNLKQNDGNNQNWISGTISWIKSSTGIQ